MMHLLEVAPLPAPYVRSLLDRAFHFKETGKYPSYPETSVATLFYEPSTRTRCSFQLAANRLAMPILNIDFSNSSEFKGETSLDTVKTLIAMGINILVVRHAVSGQIHQMAMDCCLGENVHLINAGDGINAHPTQALLDLMTILEAKPNLKQLKVAIVGDIRHSRVANSLQCIFAKLKLGKLSLISPSLWRPDEIFYGDWTDSLEEGLAGADVVMALRVQNERLGPGEELDLGQYILKYAITMKSLSFAKPDVLVMHPGPINRGIEINSDVVDGPRSLIWKQINNGVFMRMAILEAIMRGHH